MQSNAEQAVRQLLKDFSKDQGLKEIDTVSAEEHMDDGTPIRLAVTIDRNEGSALLDFEGMLSMLCMPGRLPLIYDPTCLMCAVAQPSAACCIATEHQNQACMLVVGLCCPRAHTGVDLAASSYISAEFESMPCCCEPLSTFPPLHCKLKRYESSRTLQVVLFFWWF